jgi:NAD+ kinase
MEHHAPARRGWSIMLLKIAVMPNINKDVGLKLTKKLCQYLIERGATILADVVFGGTLENCELVHFEEMLNLADIIIAVGGDGTIIHSAKHAAMFNKPVLGVNLGRLGFIAEIESNELFYLDKIISGDFSIENRMMLKVTVNEKNKSTTFYALNDAVISKGAISKIIDISLKCNGKPVSSYRADGLIIATPTGSTAYSLSAGGPVVDPKLESISVTPISPHSLVSRTVLFSQNSIIETMVSVPEGGASYLTIDGENNVELYNNDIVTITKADIYAKLIKIKDSAFYEVLYDKLMERRI